MSEETREHQRLLHPHSAQIMTQRLFPRERQYIITKSSKVLFIETDLIWNSMWGNSRIKVPSETMDVLALSTLKKNNSAKETRWTVSQQIYQKELGKEKANTNSPEIRRKLKLVPQKLYSQRVPNLIRSNWSNLSPKALLKQYSNQPEISGA